MTAYFWLEVIIGALCGGIGIWYFRRYPRKSELKAWSLNLFIAALIYVLFVLVGLNWAWFPTELFGVVIYGAFAWLGFKYSPWFIALGWGLHVLWDLLLHPAGHPGYVPSWYPGVCLGFDVAIAGYLAWVLSAKS